MTARAVRRLDLGAPGVGVALALLALLLANARLTPGFFAPAALWSMVTQSVTALLVGAGMTLVIATGGIDLSVGSVMAVASGVAVTLLPYGVLAAIAGGLVVAIAIGAANGLLISRYAILPIVVTLAVLIIGRGVAQVIVSGNPLVVFDDPTFEALGKGRVLGVPTQAILAAVVVASAAVLLRKTVLGRSIVAVGGNERAARLAGVRVSRVKVVVYATSGLLAGLAGLVETARLSATDAGTIGKGVELDAIVAAVLGGTPLAGGRGRIGGMVVGALLLSMLSATFAMHLVPYAWGLVAKAALLVAAVCLQRAGKE